MAFFLTWWPSTWWLYLVALYLVALPGGPLPGGSTWWPSTWWLYLVALYLVALPGGPLPGGGLLRSFLILPSQNKMRQISKIVLGIKKIAQIPCKSMVYDALNNYYHKF